MNLRTRILRRGALVGLAVAAASVAGTAQPTVTPASGHPVDAATLTAEPLGCTYIGPNPAIGFAGLVCGAFGHGFVVVFTTPLPTFGVF